MTPQTYGEKLVGVSFNPSGNEDINTIKEHFAKVIDLLDSKRTTERSEKNRQISIAITEAQQACMWAVRSMVESE